MTVLLTVVYSCPLCTQHTYYHPHGARAGAVASRSTPIHGVIAATAAAQRSTPPHLAEAEPEAERVAATTMEDEALGDITFEGGLSDSDGGLGEGGGDTFSVYERLPPGATITDLFNSQQALAAIASGAATDGGRICEVLLTQRLHDCFAEVRPLAFGYPGGERPHLLTSVPSVPSGTKLLPQARGQSACHQAVSRGFAAAGQLAVRPRPRSAYHAAGVCEWTRYSTARCMGLAQRRCLHGYAWVSMPHTITRRGRARVPNRPHRSRGGEQGRVLWASGCDHHALSKVARQRQVASGQRGRGYNMLCCARPGVCGVYTAGSGSTTATHLSSPRLNPVSSPTPSPPTCRLNAHLQVLSKLVRSSWDARDEAAVVCYLFLYAISLTWYYSLWGKAPSLRPQQLPGAHSSDWFEQFVGSRLNLPLIGTALMDTCAFGTFIHESDQDELYSGAPK